MTFRNIPRELNQAADDMCNRARECSDRMLVVYPEQHGSETYPIIDLDRLYAAQEQRHGATTSVLPTQ